MHRSKLIVTLAVLTAAFAFACAFATAAEPPPFKTVAQAETLILNSQFADRNAITDVTCVGLTNPKPKTNTAGQQTYHRFRCQISGAYFDTRAVVVLTGNGGFNVHPVT